jgi:hypothetical protein
MALKWKLQNLRKLRTSNRERFAALPAISQREPQGFHL